MNISYSAINSFEECPYRFKLKYIDKVPLEFGTLYTSFGQAIHSTLEKTIPDPNVDIQDIFKWLFRKELKKLPYKVKQNIFKDPDLKKIATNMAETGADLCIMTVKALEDKFPGYELIAVEPKFIEPIITEIDCKNDYDFKGIIDIIIKWNNVYCIIDFKSCSWGWDARKKTDKMITYQLSYYKHYFCLQSEEDLKNVKTYFCLIKRTAKKNNIEIFEVPVGKKKIENSLKVLNNVIYNIEKKNFPKNYTSCKWCDFHHTQYCNAK